MPDVVIDAGFDGRQLDQGLRRTEGNVRGFARNSERSMGRFERVGNRALQSIGTGLRRAGVAAAAAAAGFAAIALQQSRFVTELTNTARATGLALNEVQSFGVALQAFGRDTDAVNDLFVDMQDRITELQQGTMSFVEDFGLIGLTFRDLRGLAPEEQLRVIERRVNEVGGALAQAFAARQFSEFQQILGDITPTMDRLNERLRATGGLIEGPVEGLRSINESVLVASTTIQTQFLEGLAAANAEAGGLDETIRDIGQATRFLAETGGNAARFLADAFDSWRVILYEVQLSLLNVQAFFTNLTGGDTVDIQRQIVEVTQAQAEAIRNVAERQFQEGVAEGVSSGVNEGLRRASSTLPQTIGRGSTELTSIADRIIGDLGRQGSTTVSGVARGLEGDVFGIQRGLQERAVRNIERASQEAVEQPGVFDAVGQSLTFSLSATLANNILNGNFDNVGQAFTQIIAQTLLTALTERAIGSLLGAVGLGIPRAHDGVTVPGGRGDESVWILEGGERVIPRGQSAGGNVVNLNTQILTDGRDGALPRLVRRIQTQDLPQLAAELEGMGFRRGLS